MTRTLPASTKHNPEVNIQVLKEDECKTLTYRVGIDDNDDIHFQIASNTGGGFFSNEWVSYAAIQAAFKDWPDDSPITSMALRSLFRGKSVNTPGFLVSVLCAEGLLEPMTKRKRVHRACDPSRFLASVEELRKEAGITTGKKSAAKPKTKASPKAKAKAAPKKAPRKNR
jgi:hypothetical protein